METPIPKTGEFELHNTLAAQEGQAYWTRGIVGYFYRMYLREARTFVQRYPSCNVLEVGCGEGIMLHDLHHDANIYQLDISPVALKKATQWNGKVFVGDAMNLPFRDEVFDAVLQVALLEHVSRPDHAISEAWRVLKKGGKLLILIPNDITMSVGRMLLRKYPFRYPGHLSFLTPRRIKTIMGNRFTMLQEKRMPFNGFTFWANMYYQLVARKIS